MNKNFIKIAQRNLLVVIGTLILSFGTAVFIIPFDLVVGGISSIAIILDKIINVSFITTDMLITVITWLTFLLGLLILGKEFALKTLLSSIIYPIGITLFSKLLSPQVLDGVFCLANSEYSEIAILLAAIFGGVLIGIGCATAFLGGGSTGGIDVIAFIICKGIKKLKSSTVIFVLDAVTIILGLLVVKDLVISLLGITSAFLSALVIDKMFLGESKAFTAQIVSDNYSEINKEISEKIGRTTSIIDIEGGYSGEKKKMLTVTFTMNQYNDLLSIITGLDKSAFVTIHRAHEINGEGWTF